MDPKMEKIFAPLKVMIEAQPLALADFMEIVGGFADSAPELARAMCYHARDIDVEGAASSHATLISEVYRRTFFDREHAAKYHTTEMLDQGDSVVEDFAAHLVSSFQMDFLKESRGSMHSDAKGSH